MATSQPSAVLYEPDESERFKWAEALRGAGWRCEGVGSLGDAVVLGGGRGSGGVFFLSADGDGEALIEALDRLRCLGPSVSAIVVTSEADANAMAAWMHAGARDVLVRPVSSAAVVSAAERWRGAWVPGPVGGGGAADEGRALSDGMLSKAIHALIEVLEAKDACSVGFAKEVARVSDRLAGAMGLADDSRQAVCLAALLHDVGRVALRDDVIHKNGRLTSEELDHVKTHPVISEHILRHLFSSPEVLSAVRHHHEWYDGLGYPAGLAGEAIPLGARILSVADGFVAMTQERPHRRCWSVEEALREIEARSGRQFCPAVVSVLREVVAGESSGRGRSASAAETPARRPPGSPRGSAAGLARHELRLGEAVPAEELERRLKRVVGLKALPAVVAEVMEATADESLKVDDLADTIKCDHALSSKLLALANCALYGGRMKAESIERAVVKLGVDRIKQLVIGISVVDQWRGSDQAGPLRMEAFWRHSIATGLVARRVGAARGVEFQESAYTAGFLHDIGKLILHEALGEQYAGLLDRASTSRLYLPAAERQWLGKDHASVMEVVGSLWGMPRQLTEAMASHHMSWESLQHLPADELSLVLCVRIADNLANAMEPDLGLPVSLEAVPETFLNYLGVPGNVLENLVPGILSQVTELGQAYHIPGEGGSVGGGGDGPAGALRGGCYCSEEPPTVDPVMTFLTSQGVDVVVTDTFAMPGSGEDRTWTWVRVVTPGFLRQVIASIEGSGGDTGQARDRLLLFLPASVSDDVTSILDERNVPFLVEPWNVLTMHEALHRMAAACPRS